MNIKVGFHIILVLESLFFYSGPKCPVEENEIEMNRRMHFAER